MSILAFSKSLFFNLKTTFFRLYEWVRVATLYYPRRVRFLWIDCLFAAQYVWKSPHRMSKHFQIRRGAKNIYTFGETPLTTLDRIAKECRILSKDNLFELGCGSGRTCFWLRAFVGCRVTGIDYLPTFIQKANRIKNWSGISEIEFLKEDMFTANLRKATVIYLYGTCLEDDEIEKLIENFKDLRPKTRVISVSYPLTDYSSEFRLIKQFKGRFPWGKADIFINEKEA